MWMRVSGHPEARGRHITGAGSEGLITTAAAPPPCGTTHEKLYCVLAMHTGRPPKPCRVYSSSAAAASGLNSTHPAP